MRSLPNTLTPTTDLQQLVKRRKGLAIAAAMGVAGCNLMGPHAAPAPAPAPAASASAADEMVSSYTSDIEKALDNIDRKRLSLAKQAGQNPASVEVAKVSPVAASGSAAAAPAAVDAKPVSLTPDAAVPAKSIAVVPETIKTPAPTLSVGMPIPDPAAASARPAVATPAAAAATVPTASGGAPETVNGSPLTGLQPAATYEAIGAPPRGPATALPMINVALAAPEETPLPGSAVATATLSPVATPASAMGAMTAMLAPASPTSPAVAGRTADGGTPPADGAGRTADGASRAAAAAEPTVDDAMTILRKNISEHPTLNTALALALLDGKSSDEIAKTLSEPDQKLLADLTAALDSMKTAAASAPLAERAAPILDVAKHWQAEADLALPRLVLASRVDSYGVYTAVEPSFEQGKRHTVIIYCEVNNFGSKKSDDGWFNTKLTQQESLITEDKLLVWRPNPEDVEDRSLNQRHDFYLVKKLTLPETLAAGKYTLRMDVTDANTGKRAIQNMEIQLITK